MRRAVMDGVVGDHGLRTVEARPRVAVGNHAVSQVPGGGLLLCASAEPVLEGFSGGVSGGGSGVGGGEKGFFAGK